MVQKIYKVLISESVKISLQNQIDYIVNEQHAPEIALNWLDGIIQSINSLSKFPNRCPVAPENLLVKKDSNTIIRHFIYKKTFRIIFSVTKNEVKILSAKHSARFIFSKANELHYQDFL